MCSAEPRGEWLRALGATITAAVARRDTAHPAFHGCLDWHSAVHGCFALFAITRLTGDPAYRAAALDAVGGRAPLVAEEAAMRAGRLLQEIPYGFAWALHLDVEAHKADLDQFHGIGLAARDVLLPALSAGVADPHARDYDNLSWALYSLHRWASAFGDDSARAWAEAAAGTVLAPRPLGLICAADAPGADGFLSAPCMAVLLAWQIGVPAARVTPALEAVRALRPLPAEQIVTAHRAGLNFSRAWACHAAWEMTGDPVYRERFHELVATHIAMPGHWRDDYGRHGHWVAQFGVFALTLAADDSAAGPVL